MEKEYIFNLGMKFDSIADVAMNERAIIWDADHYASFIELDLLANQIANYLLNLGVRKNNVIAIQNNKTVFGFTIMIASLKIGAIYTNFDYTNPAERIRKIFATADPVMVLADRLNDDVRDICRSVGIEYIVITDVLSIINTMPVDIDSNVMNTVTKSDPAYIMFTSGSTGIPKGVLISHGSLLDFIAWGRQTYDLKSTDILTNVNPIYFDNSVFDFYCSIFNGIPMLAIPKETVDKPREMLDIIDRVGCTLWFSVPSLLIYLTNLRLLGNNTLQSIKTFAFGGEGYPKELLRKLYKIYGSRASFFNVYGPTEGTCICSSYLIEAKDIEADGLAPLGQIAPNFGYLILDENDNQSDIGELCLTGSQLAIGYFNDEDRTNKSFVRNPLQTRYFERIYRTGDKVEIIENKLFFRGRVDNQIKHMGYRIELEEIENAMVKIDGVKQCAAIHTLSRNNLSKIIGVIATDYNMEEAVVKNRLKTYLPSYMIPNQIVFMKELPKNPNGKVDRVGLKKIYVDTLA